MTATPLDTALLLDLATALALGALIGIERESDGGHAMGLRTFILMAALGAGTALLGAAVGSSLVFAAMATATGALIVTSHVLESKDAEHATGLTTEIAAMGVFVLGGLAVSGHRPVAVVLAIVTTAVLAYKRPLHELAGAVGRVDLEAVLKLLVATFVVLPLLPEHAVDPLGVLVPRTMWWLVILISALSLVGYVAVRMLGDRRGRALTGVFGGLVSSTAVTLSFAHDSTREGAAPGPIALGVLLAWTIMFARVLVEVAVVNRALLAHVAAPFVAMLVVSMIAVAVFARSPRGEVEDPEEPSLTNPFSLTEAVKFAALFAAVLVVVALAERYAPESWIYGIALLSGTTDVDAITLSLAGATDLSPQTATLGIVLASLSNTAVKAGLMVSIGARPVAIRLVVAACAIGAAGIATAIWAPTFG